MNIFISHRHFDADVQFANRLVATLRGWGHAPWLDHENIEPGADWVERINQGLQQAEVIVSILSEKSVDGPLVLNEWRFAIDNKKPLILVRLRPCIVPYPFNGIDYLDFFENEATGEALLEKAL